METTVLSDGVYNICPHCEKFGRSEVEEGVNVIYVYCSNCKRLIGNLDKKSKKLYYWHVYNKGSVLPEEESPYP